ncbi:unnamed protein product [Protopolystoma xenopodis]|uniref:Uncharacterized protein n=1 Tax=Protopolystoma xenopodis TaxID=117903 RepID=A0A3S5B1T9_9PLAT|nr:unnamed protein product [Protopolystoma xenopodis]
MQSSACAKYVISFYLSSFLPLSIYLSLSPPFGVCMDSLIRTLRKSTPLPKQQLELFIAPGPKGVLEGDSEEMTDRSPDTPTHHMAWTDRLSAVECG